MGNTRGLRDVLEGFNGIVRFNEPMSRYTSFRIGGPADAYVGAVRMSKLSGS